MTFLPYHTTEQFRTLMSILPTDIPHEFRFLDPYIRQLVVPPRAAIVQQATSRPEFLAALSSYTLESCRSQQEYPALIGFWGGVTTQAVNGMVDKLRSGTRSVQADNDQILLQRILPTLSETLMMKSVPDMQIASYTIVALLAAKGNLDDGALSAVMDQLVHGWTRKTLRAGLVSLSILAHHRSAKQLPVKVAKSLLKVQDLPQTLKEIGQTYRVGKLSNGLALALVDRLGKKGDARGLSVVKALLLDHILPEKQVKVIYKALLVAAYKIPDDVDADGAVRKQLGSLLVSLSQASGEVGDVIRATIEEVDFDIEELELKLEANIRPALAIEAPQEDSAMGNGIAVDETKEKVGEALARIAKDCKKIPTCFTTEPSDIFNELCSLFVSVATVETDLAEFDQSPLLSRSEAVKRPFYVSFYIRIWCGQYPTLARALALERVKEFLKEGGSDSDFQALLPYCIAALNDPAKRVRRAAADLIAVLGSLEPSQSKKSDPWGSAALYEGDGDLVWMSKEGSNDLIHKIILPALEESVLHADYIVEILKGALDGSLAAPEANSQSRHISHATRLSIMTSLSSHVALTPFLTVKLRLLKSLNQVRSISGTSRTQLLLPVLQWWAGLEVAEASKLAERESIDEKVADKAFVETVSVNDKSGLEYLLSLITSSESIARQDLVESVFSRLRAMWPLMKEGVQLSTAKVLLDLVQIDPQASADRKAVSLEAASLLEEVDLTTNILFEFLASLDDLTQMATESPANKRRRVSMAEQRENIQSLHDSGRLTAARNKASFVLSLVQSSKPETHPELLESLFTTLSNVQHLGTLSGSELGYLLGSVLASLNKMIPAYRNNKDLRIDASVGHGDILATCIQKSSSPTVINEALLLVASLARVAPEVVLHSVMPIFAFMGSSVMKHADEYSALVVNKTITEVIPPLIDTFRKSRRSLVSSASELLSSFVVAYEHIPSHRKRDIFVSLIENLGPTEFLFAVLAMFVDRYGTTDNITAFLAEIVNKFPVEVQLQTLVKTVDLVDDIFKPKPVLVPVLLGKNENEEYDAQKSALKQLTLLPQLLSNGRLRREINLLAERDDMEAGKIRDLYATLLEDILALASTVKSQKALYSRCEDALGNLLNLLSISEFVKSVETLLDRPNVSLRQKVLRALELRVDTEKTSDAKSRAALLAFLPQLTAVIRESRDIDYKRTAVTCVDKIAEKYGKKDLEAVAAAAETIAGDQCLGQPTDRLRIMALLCLASLVDVLQDSIVPVLPAAIPKALDYLQSSLQESTWNPELHNASYAFITSLTQHLPFMLSGAYLDRILLCSAASAAATALDEDAVTNRKQCLGFLAKLVDPKTLFQAMERNWDTIARSGFSVRDTRVRMTMKTCANNQQAIAEYLEVLGTAINKQPKSAVSKNVMALSGIFLKALDLRRENRSGDSAAVLDTTSLDKIKTGIDQVALGMIYKLNDATFRPMFSELMEWSSSGLPKTDVSGRTLRQESVYGFLSTFFGTLKSIVTSYVSYVFEDAVRVLRETDAADADQQELWKTVLKTFSKSFEHDQDNFWQTPSHFDAVAPVLVEQFLRAGSVSSLDELLAAVVELAAAADSRDHQKDLNTAMLKLLRNENAAVRLAVIKCQQALTERLGEEWLQTLPEMLPYISELQDDDDEVVERENRRWIVGIEETLGESLDAMLQ